MGFVVGAVEGDAAAAGNTALLELDIVREADFGFSTLIPPSLRWYDETSRPLPATAPQSNPADVDVTVDGVIRELLEAEVGASLRQLDHTAGDPLVVLCVAVEVSPSTLSVRALMFSEGRDELEARLPGRMSLSVIPAPERAASPIDGPLLARIAGGGLYLAGGMVAGVVVPVPVPEVLS